VICIGITLITVLAYIAILLRIDSQRKLAEFAGIRAALAPLVGIRSDLDLALSAGLARSLPRPTKEPKEGLQTPKQTPIEGHESTEELTCIMSRSDRPHSRTGGSEEISLTEDHLPHSRAGLYPVMRPPPPSAGPLTPTRLSANTQTRAAGS
jgi:hypothetical protein